MSRRRFTRLTNGFSKKERTTGQRRLFGIAGTTSGASPRQWRRESVITCGVCGNYWKRRERGGLPNAIPRWVNM